MARIPRCCPAHRMAALDAIGELIAVDALGHIVRAAPDFHAAGAHLTDFAESYKRWLLARVADAIDVGVSVGLVVAEQERAA